MKLEELEVYITDKKRPANFINRIGWENEYFKVISEAPPILKNGNYRTRWNCLCKACGEYCVKDATNLTKHKSCGCAKKTNIGKALRKDYTGQRFGMLTAIEYAGYSNKCRNAVWKCKCDCGNITYVDSNNLNTNHTLSCGCINYSIGVENISKILNNNNINFKKEYSIKELYDVSPQNPFKLDFIIYDDNGKISRAIEYDGIQHFVEAWGIWKTNITLTKQQERDKRKNRWCLEHNIPLVRIPYWERDNITLEMIMGDQYLVK